MKKIKISVTEFAQPLARSGSIRREGPVSGMELGSRVHKKIQLALAKILTYKPEVLLKRQFTSKRFNFELSGRADGIIYGQTNIVDEIKSTFSLERLREDIEENSMHPYRLQALTYAYMVSLDLHTPVIAQLRLVSLRNKKEHLIKLELSDEFNEWFAARLQQLENEARLQATQRRKRKGIASTIVFPFVPARPHQLDLVEAVEKEAKKGGRALIQAPTGIGKTVGVLFPIITASFKRGNRVFYLTPKNSQFEVAKEAVERICNNRAIKSRTLTSKRKLCRKEFMDCNPDYCEFAHSYYDKMEKGDLYNQVQRLGHCGTTEIQQLADQHEVCPYQLQMDTLGSADLIVGDYNYVFSPNAGLSGLFSDLEKGRKPGLIIDEVHNLYTRGMEYYSPSIRVSFFEEIDGFSVPKKLKKRFRRILSECKALVSQYRPSPLVSTAVALNSQAFIMLNEQIHSLLLDYIGETSSLTDTDPVLELYRIWSAFTDVLRIRDEETQSAYTYDRGGESLQLICCDPSRFLSATFEHFFSVTGFSATIKPFDFYRKLSGFPETTLTREFPSGFPNEHRKVMIIPQVSTTYRQRERNYKKIGEAICRIALENPGNYLAFFSSYDFMAKTREFLDEFGLNIVAQRRDSRPADVKEIEALLTAANTKNLVLAVQGGALSEGVDFNSRHLKGAFIVGPAVPLVTFERELLRAYFQEKFGNGFSYAYAWPAMTRSVQASGRVIRDMKKRGLIVLMDGRFLLDPYTQSLPDFWYNKSPTELVSRSVLADVRDFWQDDRL